MSFRVLFVMFFLSFGAIANVKSAAYGEGNAIKYGVAYCLSTVYPNTVFSSDARYTSGVYVQLGGYGVQVYAAIRDYVDDYQQKKYLSKYDKNLAMMQCIDLFESDKLKKVIGQVPDEDG